MMLGCSSRLASAQHASTSGASQPRKLLGRSAAARACTPSRSAGAGQLGSLRLERGHFVRTGFGVRAAEKAAQPQQQPANGGAEGAERLQYAEVDADAATPHSVDYREFVEAQLEVVGHAFGERGDAERFTCD